VTALMLSAKNKTVQNMHHAVCDFKQSFKHGFNLH